VHAVADGPGFRQPLPERVIQIGHRGDQVGVEDQACGECFGLADAPTAVIHQRDVAAVAVRVLTDDAYSGAKHVLTGPEVLSRAGQVQVIGEAIGRPLRFEKVPRSGRA